MVEEGKDTVWVSSSRNHRGIAGKEILIFSPLPSPVVVGDSYLLKF